ncbi:MAG TPA: hypothetical protein VJ553_00365 [Candidatus Paceibacterota bacterium]|nr:hypothetical protein [Candidatus Paceibacterota bacterium]
MLMFLLKSCFPIPGEIGGPPYGQLYGPRFPGVDSEEMVQLMREAAESEAIRHLFADGDIVQGS